MAPKKKIPDRWNDYNNHGIRIPDTPFVAFKVPLQNNQAWNPEHLAKAFPNMVSVIDLTNTNRYYDKHALTRLFEKPLTYHKINTEGRMVPSKRVVDSFFQAVNSILAVNDADALIGVHCTHGVNRTGYLICSYLIKTLLWSADSAVSEFARCRGHPIERQNYVKDLLRGSGGQGQGRRSSPPRRHWRDRRHDQPYSAPDCPHPRPQRPQHYQDQGYFQHDQDPRYYYY